MRKVLIFSLAYSPFVGGAEVATAEITKRISDIEFDMITLRFDRASPKFERVGNMNVYRLGFTKEKATMADMVRFPLTFNKYLFPFLAFLKANALHRKNTYDGIWAVMANYAGFGALFFKYAHPHIPFLLTLQEGDPIDYIKRRVGFLYPLFKRIFTRADFVQVISQYLGKWARDTGFTGPLEIVPNGVDTVHFTHSYPAQELDALKKKLGKKSNDAYLITTSRLVEKNAVGDIIESLQHLPENIKLLIAGIGPLEEELRSRVARFTLQDRVLFLGQISHAVLPKYLRISDIFIRPSLSEGMGSSFVEAMAAEVPVIATRVGGIVDFLKDGETGLFCEVRNPVSIADAVSRLLSDAHLKNTIISNARDLAWKEYDWDIIAKDMRQKVFEPLMKRQP